MSKLPGPNATTAYIEQLEQSGLTTVKFLWGIAQPDHTYTVASGDVSLELDRHQVARPSGLQWRQGNNIGSELIIKNCFGKELFESITSIHDEAVVVTAGIAINLDKEKRLEIAKIQYLSPSTPPKLYIHLGSFLRNNNQLPESAAA